VPKEEPTPVLLANRAKEVRDTEEGSQRSRPEPLSETELNEELIEFIVCVPYRM
jgi:hypothetical protein